MSSVFSLKKTTDTEQYSNLSNDGSVAANDHYIFMSNRDNQLVKLDKDMNVVKTYDVKYATYLNLVGEKLYYTDKDHHICVLDTKTEKTETLQDVSAFYMTYHIISSIIRMMVIKKVFMLMIFLVKFLQSF